MLRMPDTLDSIMKELRDRINTPDTETDVSPEEIIALRDESVVVMPAGGRGTRIRTETQNEGINKVMIRLDGHESMIERMVREYSEAGFKQFLVLTGFLAEKVEEHLGDGSRWGVEIRYSRDPDGRKVGNAGAILNALQNGQLDKTKTALVHNPDDVIIGLEGKHGLAFLRGHLKGLKNGCLATLAVVPESPFQYSGMVIDKGFVRDIRKYPAIAVPAHTGITVFDAAAYSYFESLVSLEEESSFENAVCPVLSQENKLFAMNIASSAWIPVNDLKGLEQAAGLLKEPE